MEKEKLLKIKEEPVSLGWQLVISFMPILSFWAYMKIKCFWKGILINFIKIGSIGLIIVTLNYIAVIDIAGQEMIWFMWIGLFITHVYFIIRWSIQWNKIMEEKLI